MFKAARYYRMDAHGINTLATGEIDYDHLQKKIAENIDKPVIINVNVGTTVKGAVDNLDRILRILSNMKIPRERFYIHCDGALFALMEEAEISPKMLYNAVQKYGTRRMKRQFTPSHAEEMV